MGPPWLGSGRTCTEGLLMPTKPLSRDFAEKAVKAVEDQLRQGFRPAGMPGSGTAAIAAAASELGIPIGTLQGRLRAAKLHYGLEPR